jgi:hypothetical protein
MFIAITKGLRVLTLTSVLALAVFAFGGESRAGDSSGRTGAVFTLTNSLAGNEVLVHQRSGDGSLHCLTLAWSFATGGTGTGSGLGSQHAVIVSDNQKFLFAVNAVATQSRPSVSAVGVVGMMTMTAIMVMVGEVKPLNSSAPSHLVARCLPAWRSTVGVVKVMKR